VIVVDASALLEVLLRTASAARVEERLFGRGDALHAPHLLDAEIVQVMRRYATKREVGEAQAREALDVFGELPIIRHGHTPLLGRVWALRNNLTAYDAMYVALAEALDAPLVTRDSGLRYAAGNQATIELV
jgi:predicted nucleic acid-binding protein